VADGGGERQRQTASVATMKTSFSEKVRKRRPSSETSRESRIRNRKSEKVSNSSGERRIAGQRQMAVVNGGGEWRRRMATANGDGKWRRRRATADGGGDWLCSFSLFHCICAAAVVAADAALETIWI
jgi:hypothetical protein